VELRRAEEDPGLRHGRLRRSGASDAQPRNRALPRKLEVAAQVTSSPASGLPAGTLASTRLNRETRARAARSARYRSVSIADSFSATAVLISGLIEIPSSPARSLA
jgi:hypothetical protein